MPSNFWWYIRQRRDRRTGHIVMTPKIHFTLLLVLLIQVHVTQAQCPGATSCDATEIICSVASLDGFSCEGPDLVNSSFPLPNLCNGNGVAQNISWWSFTGAGGALSITVSYDLALCESGKGLQAGIFEGNCNGSTIWDCNSECDLSQFTLSGQTKPCKAYYLWIDGCEGDWCRFTLSVSGNTSPPQIPRIPDLTTSDKIQPCGSFEVCAPLLGDCEPFLEWFLDGQRQGDGDCYDFTVPPHIQAGEPLVICLVATIGDPNSPNTICDQQQKCTTFLVDSIEKREGPLLRIQPNQQPFVWNGMAISSSCINPPCSTRIDQSGFCYDTCQPIELLFADSTAIIKGKAYIDLNSNCQIDSSEPILVGANIRIESQSHQFQTITDSNGHYSTIVPFESYLISATHPLYQIDNCPDSITSLVNEKGKEYCHDFFFQSSDTCENISLRWIPLTGRNRVRCDPRNRMIQLEVFNPGATAFGARRMRVEVDDEVVWLPSPDYQIIGPSVLEFNQSQLAPGEMQRWTLLFKGDCNAMHDVGKKVCFTAEFTPPLLCDNEVVEAEYCDFIRNSFDPNDLTIRPHGELKPRFIDRGELLYGLIRFQNTGTDTAYDIVVDLELDMTSYHLDGFFISDASATHIISELLPQKNLIRFTMSDIKLPHEAIDSVGSNGFIRFQLPVDPALPDWSRLEQTAQIYFDFNPPIVTNTEFQTIAPPYVNTTVKENLCAGDFYGEMRITADTTLIDTLERFGPDTILRTEIVVHSVHERMETLDLVLPDTLHGIVVTVDTAFSVTLKTMQGCDSIIHYDIRALTTSTNDPGTPHFSVYPNPVRGDYFWIRSNLKLPYTLQIFDLEGRMSSSHEINLPHQRLSSHSMAVGTYIYQITYNNKLVQSGKLIRKE